MQRTSDARFLKIPYIWWSKITDGILTAIILILLWFTIALAVRPIETFFGRPGLLVYVIGLLAVSMFSLQQSIDPQKGQITRTWYGIAGGFLAWAVIEVLGKLGVPVMPNSASIILLIMVALIVGLLWRHYLPLGMRFFSLILLLSWTELVLMDAQEFLAQYSPIFALSYRATGFIAAIAVLLVLGWILFHTQRRIERVAGALAVWFLISLMLYVFRGSLF